MNEPLFERLAQEPDSEYLRSHLGVIGAQRPRPGLAVFPVWQRDFIGPGGAVKGYAYAADPPELLVDSIERNVEPGSPMQTELYLRLKGHWYLYYASFH